jgi:hypothetical protein
MIQVLGQDEWWLSCFFKFSYWIGLVNYTHILYISHVKNASIDSQANVLK